MGLKITPNVKTFQPFSEISDCWLIFDALTLFLFLIDNKHPTPPSSSLLTMQVSPFFAPPRQLPVAKDFDAFGREPPAELTESHFRSMA